MDYIVWAISFFVGTLLGKWIFSVRQKMRPRQEPVGTLVVDRSDPDGPFLFLELGSSVERIEREETVLLRVERRKYLSQD